MKVCNIIDWIKTKKKERKKLEINILVYVGELHDGSSFVDTKARYIWVVQKLPAYTDFTWKNHSVHSVNIAKSVIVDNNRA